VGSVVLPLLFEPLQAAPLLSTSHTHAIAVTPVGNGSVTVTVSAAVPALLSTVTVYVASSPAITLSGPVFVMVTCAYKFIEPKANNPAQRTFRLRIIELRNMCASPQRRIDDAYPDEDADYDEVGAGGSVRMRRR
jgi:hypothetical protein